MKNAILIILLTFFSSSALASADTDRFIEGCKQLANMYDSRSEINLLSSLTLSPSDTLMAGYCKGIIESFVSFASVRAYRCGRYSNEYCQERLCSESNWYNIAKRIALKDPKSDTNYDGYFDMEDIIIYGCR